jgi:hypothetical protein
VGCCGEDENALSSHWQPGDVFLRPEQIKAWFDRLAASDKTFRLYQDAYHLQWNDWDKDLVLADILDWLNDRSVLRSAFEDTRKKFAQPLFSAC